MRVALEQVQAFASEDSCQNLFLYVPFPFTVILAFSAPLLSLTVRDVTAFVLVWFIRPTTSINGNRMFGPWRASTVGVTAHVL
jgi:hypothetical protein